MPSPIDPTRLSMVHAQPSSPYLLQHHPPEISPFEQVASALRRRKLLVLCSIVSCLAFSVALWTRLTPKYESYVLLEVNKADTDRLGLDAESTGSPAGADALEFNITMDTHARALTTDTLALAVIQQMHLDRRPEFSWKPSAFDAPSVKNEVQLPLDSAPHKRAALIKAFQHQLKVKPLAGSRLLEIRFKDSDPQVAADVANAITNTYIEQNFRTRYAATAQVSDWLSKQLDELKSQVNVAEHNVADYEQRAGILGTDGAVNVVLSKLDDLNKRLTEAEDNRITRQAIYELAKSGNAELITGLAGMALSGPGLSMQNPLEQLQHLRAQQSDLRVQYAQASKRFGSAYPSVIELRSQMDAVNNNIQEELGKVTQRAETDFRAAQRAEEMLKSSFEQQKENANKLNNSAIQFKILRDQAESDRALYTGLETKLKSAGVLSGLRSTNLVVLDPARPAVDPVRPLSMFLAIGCGLGLLGGCALAFLREALDNTVRTPDQVEMVTHLPQLGLVPHIRSIPMKRADRKRLKHSARPISLTASESAVTECYRHLRSALVYGSQGRSKAIMVTSALTGDGKTTTAVNLAAVLVQQGAQVLLVDADLRRPSIQSHLRLHGEGLGTVLTRTEANADDFVTELADQPGLSVLAGIEKVKGTAEVLSSNRMTELIGEWRKRFDYIIFDTPPVLSVTDAVALSSKVDAIVIVTRAEVTPVAALMRAKDLLLRANAPLAGVLVNAVHANSAEYNRYYGVRDASKTVGGYYDNALVG